MQWLLLNARPGRRTGRERGQTMTGWARGAGRWGAALAMLLLWPTGVRAVPPVAVPRDTVPRDTVPAPQYFPPLACAPLDPPLRLSGSFGEYRPGHFHAGVDLGTGGVVGSPVYASLAGHVVRVRASGIGYGRSVYVQGDDGRLLVYGHLDAFDGPLAAWVDAVQDSSGEYEQDLWPAPGRFPVRAGQRLGWSGRSGTDSPHLHFEIRRGDVAYNPLLAGLSLPDTIAPRLGHLALVPLRADAGGGRPASPTILECSGGDTTLLVGVGRLVVEAVDARDDGRFTVAPWRIRLEGAGQTVECRFDSVSWAEGMTEVDAVYDRGRTLPDGRHAYVLGAPAGFRPRVLDTSAPPGAAAGELEVPAGSRPLALRLTARDVAGGMAVQTLLLAEGQPLAGAPGVPPGVHATPDSAAGGAIAGFAWSATAGTLFEEAWLAVRETGRPEGPEELRACSRRFELTPALTPLRRALHVRLLASGGARAGRVAPAVYRDSGAGWEYLGGRPGRDGGWIEADSRAPGGFALFRDVTAPRVRIFAPPRTAPPGPYPRWALEARIEEEGSGVDARASRLLVDGRRVPAEWDAVAATLRWRPQRPPAPGRHHVVAVVVDRAGNVRRRHAGFVLDSAAPEPAREPRATPDSDSSAP